MFRNLARQKPAGLADLLLPFALVEDGVLLQNDGSLLAGWKYAGPDTETATYPQMAALADRLNEMLRLGSGWMIQANGFRSKASGYPAAGAFPEPHSRTPFDTVRRAPSGRLFGEWPVVSASRGVLSGLRVTRPERAATLATMRLWDQSRNANQR